MVVSFIFNFPANFLQILAEARSGGTGSRSKAADGGSYDSEFQNKAFTV